MIDYRFIRKQVNRDDEKYEVEEIGYDPWNAELLCNQQLGQEDGLPVVEVRQTIGSLGQATVEFEKLLVAGRLRHNGNPVLTWMAGNRVVRSDHNDNIMPSKKHSAGRIDGIVATIIALSRCIANGAGWCMTSGEFCGCRCRGCDAGSLRGKFTIRPTFEIPTSFSSPT